MTFKYNGKNKNSGNMKCYALLVFKEREKRAVDLRLSAFNYALSDEKNENGMITYYIEVADYHEYRSFMSEWNRRFGKRRQEEHTQAYSMALQELTRIL